MDINPRRRACGFDFFNSDIVNLLLKDSRGETEGLI